MAQVYPAKEETHEEESTSDEKVSPNKGIKALVIDPSKMPEAEAPIEAGRPNDRLAHLRRYVDNKTCYHSAALPEAAVLRDEDRVAYQVEIWSLMEKRWVTWEDKPYAQEPVPNGAVGNIFTTYDFPPPDTLIKGKLESIETLPHTQRVISCPPCGGNGTNACFWCGATGRRTCFSCGGNRLNSDGRRCTSCNGSGTKICSNCNGEGRTPCSRCAKKGQLLSWAVVHASWETVTSIIFPQSSFLPNKYILSALGKEVAFENDILWATDAEAKNWQRHVTLERFPQLYACIAKTPVNFVSNINEQYQKKHLEKLDENMHIRKLKITIQKLDIKEIDYKTGKYKNKRHGTDGEDLFTFLQYGRDDRGFPLIYEEDYPLRNCGCCGLKCAEACTCVIS